MAEQKSIYNEKDISKTFDRYIRLLFKQYGIQGNSKSIDSEKELAIVD